jgi:gas vesicle protein
MNVMTNILIRKIKMTEEMMEEILDNWIVWSKEIQQNNKSTWSQRDDAIMRAITKILEKKLYEYKK